jgi:hypothetical protein
MICITLTAISRHVIKELMASRVRTVEIRSPHNFFSLREVAVGDLIFLTDASLTDIVPGTCGLIAKVSEIQMMTHRMIHSADSFYEEIESQAARVQLNLVGIGRARGVASSGFPLRLEVDQVPYCSAR